MLLFDGHRVETAANRPEALALFQKGNFDLTMLDYEMPKMKGDQLAAAIKSIAPSQPIVMFTGYAEAVRVAPDGNVVVDLILGKPFDLEELRRTISQLLPSGAP